MEIILSALTLGLIGSFHCAGMCGPIAIALPLGKSYYLRRLFGGLSYNIGRTVTYGIMGAIFGLLGQGISLAGFQSIISIIMGALMILAVIFPRIFNKSSAIGNITAKFTMKVQNKLGSMFNKGSIPSLFMIGLLNGLLPCGLVYMALAASIASGAVVDGVLFMVFFGLGTIPMLFGISLIGNMASVSLRNYFNKVLPGVIIIIGLIFILRGMDLKIPYLSPPKEKLEIQNHIKKAETEETTVKGACCN